MMGDGGSRENDECAICGAKLSGLTLRRHSDHASRQTYDKQGEASKRALRDPQLLRHAQRLAWSIGATGTMKGGV